MRLIVDEFGRIEISRKGMFILNQKPISPEQIRRAKRSLQNKIVGVREDISALKQGLIDYENTLSRLNSSVVDKYIAKEMHRRDLIDQKSHRILKQYIGDAQYKYLYDHGSIFLKGKDGLTYKIDRQGRIYRMDGEAVKRLCVVRPSELPLPDFIIALLVNFKHNPSKFRNVV
jgi:hypothetical protein